MHNRQVLGQAGWLPLGGHAVLLRRVDRARHTGGQEQSRRERRSRCAKLLKALGALLMRHSLNVPHLVAILIMMVIGPEQHGYG